MFGEHARYFEISGENAEIVDWLAERVEKGDFAPLERKSDHLANGVESEVAVTAPMALLQIGTGSRP